MPKRDDQLLLKDIIEAGNKIIKYTKGLTYESFLEDERTIDAVLRNFEVIGEAANRLSESFKIENPNIEWRKLIAFRNLLIHEYFGVDLVIVYDVINMLLPSSIASLETLISK